MDKYIDGFYLTSMKTEIKVNYFITFHYFEYSNKYYFKGERHNFWELLYVDKGMVFVRTDTDFHQLQQDQIIFHKPNEFHSVECNGVTSPCLVVISFDCQSPKMSFFKNKVINITNKTKALLSFIINEAQKVYSTDLSDPYYTKLEVSETCPFGSQQLIKNYFEAFLIELIVHNAHTEESDITYSSTQTRDRKNRYDFANAYLLNHLADNLTLQDICNHCSMSKSLAQKIFKLETGTSVMRWYNRQRIEKAKQLIREGNGNMTTIAYQLGYNSIHHFSKQFSKFTGRSPSEYAKSIVSLLNVDHELS